MKDRGKEKEKLLGWAADVILRRMEQKARRKWGANNSPLSLSSPSLPLCLSLPLFFKVFMVTNLLTLEHMAHTLQFVTVSSAVTPLSWHHGATVV